MSTSTPKPRWRRVANSASFSSGPALGRARPTRSAAQQMLTVSAAAEAVSRRTRLLDRLQGRWISCVVQERWLVVVGIAPLRPHQMLESLDPIQRRRKRNIDRFPRHALSLIGRATCLTILVVGERANGAHRKG